MILKYALEAILFAAGDPVPKERLCVGTGETPEAVELALCELESELSYNMRGIRLVRMNDRVQLCSSPEFASVVRLALETRRPPALSQTSLEVLAIIAYKQPATRAVVEQIRGVDSSYTISALSDKGLIAECGRLEAPGRPALFKTTDRFLRVFGISSLAELPELPALSKESETTEATA